MPQIYDPGDLLSLVTDLIPVYLHRYRWLEAEHPRHDSGRPDGGQFRSDGSSAAGSGPVTAKANNSGGQFRSTRRREIAALPDTVKPGYSLHLSSLDIDTVNNLQGWRDRLRAEVSQVEKAGSEQDKEYAWSQVNKDAIRSLLSEMNEMDRQHGQQSGQKLSDWVNANGMIPRFVAERLDSGRRFFDPERIRNKLPETNKAASIFSDDEKKILREYNQSSRDDRQKALRDPQKREIVERAMGLSTAHARIPDPMTGQVASPPGSQLSTPEEAETGNQATEQKDSSTKAKKPSGELSTQFQNRMKSLIESYVGDDNSEAHSALEKSVPEAWRTLKQETEEWNEGLRGIFGGISAKGQALGSMIQKVGRAQDPMSIVGFDEYVDFARRHFPHIVANKWGEEEGLMEAFRTGIKPVPKIDSQEVIERAVDMLGPGFRKMLEEGTPEESFIPDSLPVFDDGDPLPFSIRAWISWLNHPRNLRN